MATVQTSRSPTLTERIVSIDVCRGLTMLVMLFFNDINDADLGNVQNVASGWRHMPGDIDGMTFPDVIFPVFLFLVGLSIPIALGRRIARGDSWAKLVWHILSRSIALIFIGVCLLNAETPLPLDSAAMGMSAPLWRMLLFVGILALWCRYPRLEGAGKWFLVGVRVLAAALLIYLVAVYRAVGPDGNVMWMRTEWWGIIGLIGWAYLIAALVWLGCRHHGTAIMGAMALLAVVGGQGAFSGMLSWWRTYLAAPASLPDGVGFLPTLEIAGLAALVVGGLIVATLFRPGATSATPGNRIGWMLMFAAGFALAAYLLRPIWGIHKIGASPSWVLYSLAAAYVFYAALYWLVDVMKLMSPRGVVALAGSNTLLMYILHPAFYWLLTLLGIDYLQTHFTEGWIGICRAAVVALFLFGLTALLTRVRVRLQL